LSQKWGPLHSSEKKTVSLDGAELTALEGIKAITVKLANGDQFLLEDDCDEKPTI
jgi:hypothetical protein